jgi:hypothetical protein
MGCPFQQNKIVLQFFERSKPSHAKTTSKLRQASPGMRDFERWF